MARKHLHLLYLRRTIQHPWRIQRLVLDGHDGCVQEVRFRTSAQALPAGSSDVYAVL